MAVRTCLTHLDKAICRRRKVYTGVGTVYRESLRGRTKLHGHPQMPEKASGHRVSRLDVQGPGIVGRATGWEQRENNHRLSQMVQSPSHLLLRWTRKSRQKARALAAICWLQLNCSTNPQRSATRPETSLSSKVFSPFSDVFASQLWKKLVDVGPGASHSVAIPGLPTLAKCWSYCPAFRF